ncbi:endonuclease/exonuclease/phosphatase family protein [Streptomyces sp. NPDC058155]|uniref:endonuclease/exonuclease/phosphatase family protein n=1 Tax=Streptomyces sp. NPDC058155 TaxID=3346359 RepID=UPI0036F02B57
MFPRVQRRRKLRTLGAAVAAAALCFLPATTGAASERAGSARSAEFIDGVMTWNVRGSWDQYDKWAGDIHTWSPGIVGLQEFCYNHLDNFREELAQRGLNYQIFWGEAEPSSAGTGCSLFGDPMGQLLLVDPALNPRSHVNTKYPARPGGNQDSEQRAYQALTITFAGQNIRVFNTHMGLEGDALWHIQKLAEAAGASPKAILMGDFNIRSTNTAALANLTSKGFQAWHLTPGGDGDNRHDLYDTAINDPDDQYIEPNLKLDHIYTKNVTGAMLDPLFPVWNDSSDHRALLLNMCTDCDK